MITIVGVGALGSHVALFLRNSKQRIRIVDFDRVEQKNTQAQVHTIMSLGKNKAHSLGQALFGMFGIKVDAIPVRVADTNVEVLLKDSELVIDCTDNLAARDVIQRFCTVSSPQIPCLHGALSASGDFARIVWTEHFTADAEGKDGEATCIDGEHLPFFALAASHIALSAQRFLKTGTKQSFQISPTGVLRI